MATSQKPATPADPINPVDVSAKATPVKPAPAVRMPSSMGATFAERRAAREGKQIGSESAENKAVTAAENKTPDGKTTDNTGPGE